MRNRPWDRTCRTILPWSVVLLGALTTGPAALAATADLRPVARSQPSGSDTASTLPISEPRFDLGATFYVEVWAQTTHASGLSSVSLDLTYEPSLASAVTITHTSLFSSLPNGSIDPGAGRVDDLSGSHLGPCSDAVGVAPNWARMAIVEMIVVASGVLSLQTGPSGSPAFGTAVCGVGDIDPAQIGFEPSVAVVGDVDIPAVSEWGIASLGLCTLIAGSLILRQRRVGG